MNNSCITNGQIWGTFSNLIRLISLSKSRWAFNRDPFQVNNVYPGEDAATTGKSIEQPQEVPDLNNKGIPILIPAGSNKAVNIPPLRTNQPKEGDIKNLVLSKQEPE